MNVYKCINAVMAELAKHGIAKDRRNTQGSGYNFRGVDDVYNALAPLLSKHGLVILPRMLSRHCDERLSSKGGNLFYVTVEAEFDFVCAEDCSKHTVKTFGEAMDSGDKATNKAMSAAFKYAAFQAFCIPTEGDNDADAHTHEVAHGMTSQQIDHFINIMEMAANAEQLKQAFDAAIKAAKQANDKVAYQNFIDCKDKCKKDLAE